MRKFFATFQRQEARNDINGTGGAWVTLFQEWAKVTPLTGRELLNAAQTQAQGTHLIEVPHGRTARDLKSKDRVKIEREELVDTSDRTADANFRFYNIESVINVNERNRTLQLVCLEP